MHRGDPEEEHHKDIVDQPVRRHSDLAPEQGEAEQHVFDHVGIGSFSNDVREHNCRDYAHYERDGEHAQRFHKATLLSGDRKSTRLNSSHVAISYAVFCLKKKKTKRITQYAM